MAVDTVTDVSTALETTLLLAMPAADPLVARHRDDLDLAAQDGIPAHVSVVYPFKPLAEIIAADHATLEGIVGHRRGFTIRGSQTAWLGDSVLCVAVDDPEPTRELIAAVVGAFPGFLPYAGSVSLDAVIPHLTVGHDHTREELQTAEQDVRKGLPVSQWIDHVQLWAGPAVGNRKHSATWHFVRFYTLDCS